MLNPPLQELRITDHIGGRGLSGKTHPRLQSLQALFKRVGSHSSAPSVYASNVGRKGVRVYGQTGQKDDGSEYHA